MTTAERSAELMRRYVLEFLATKDYEARHMIVLKMAVLPSREDIEIELSVFKIAKFYAAMARWNFQHNTFDPDCTCISEEV